MNKLDPDKEPAVVALSKVIEDMFYTITFGLNKSRDFCNQIWFWREMTKRHLVKYLEIASNESLALSARSLLYAYTYPGTREGLIQLVAGIFGSHSLVFIEDDEKPAVLGLKIENANENFNIALAVDTLTTLTTEDRKFTLIMLDLKRMIMHDTKSFIKQFLTPGRVLGEIEIK